MFTIIVYLAISVIIFTAYGFVVNARLRMEAGLPVRRNRRN